MFLNRRRLTTCGEVLGNRQQLLSAEIPYKEGASLPYEWSSQMIQQNINCVTSSFRSWTPARLGHLHAVAQMVVLYREYRSTGTRKFRVVLSRPLPDMLTFHPHQQLKWSRNTWLPARTQCKATSPNCHDTRRIQKRASRSTTQTLRSSWQRCLHHTSPQTWAICLSEPATDSFSIDQPTREGLVFKTAVPKIGSTTHPPNQRWYRDNRRRRDP